MLFSEASLILWKKQENEIAMVDIFADEGAKENKENWTIYKMLRGHIDDICDLCWSSCSQFLVSGSIDNTAIMWDAIKGKNIGLLNDHKSFVQGVAWDPKSQYIATLGHDRHMRLFNISNSKTVYRVHKTTLPSSNPEVIKQSKLFYDDTLKSYCRRLSFSPDGEVIVAPTGILENESGKHINGSYLFSRHAPSKPVIFLPTNDKFTIAARFCPKLFQIQPLLNTSEEDTDSKKEPWEKYSNLFRLPYRMIFAVATEKFVLLYDTQQVLPFAKISNIHYTRLTDITWSDDGRLLVVSSTDGYCSLISFGEEELGGFYDPTPAPSKETTPISKSSTPMREKTPDASKENSPCSKGSTPVKSKSPNISKEKTCKNNISKSFEKEEEKDTLSNSHSEKMETDDEKKENDVIEKKDEVIPKKIEVKRSADSNNKPVKRVSLITLSRPSNSADPCTSKSTVSKPVVPEKDSGSSKEEEVASNVSKKTSESPKKESLDNTSSKNKASRRISLITISSPKANKDSKNEKES